MDQRMPGPGAEQVEPLPAAPDPGETAALLQEQLRVAASVLQALATQVREARGLLDHLDRRSRAIGRIDEQIAVMEDRAEAITRLVESAEVNVAMMVSRAARRASDGAAAVSPSRE